MVIMALHVILLMVIMSSADKQQEIDVPTLKVEDTDARKHKDKNKAGKRAPLSQISGVRKLKHTNSFTGVVPKFGVETKKPEELAKVSVNS